MLEEQKNTDLRQPLLNPAEGNAPGIQRQNSGDVQRRPSREGRRSIAQVRDNVTIHHVRTSLVQIGYWNKIQILVSVGKVGISLFVMGFFPTSCNVDLVSWVWFMILHDIACAAFTGWLVFLQERSASQRPVREMQFDMEMQDLSRPAAASQSPRNAQNVRTTQQQPGPRSNPDTLNEEMIWDDAVGAQSNETLKCLDELIRLCYFILFLYGHILYYKPDSNCKELAPALDSLMLAYLVMGYLYLGIPALVFLSVCFCLPCFLLVWYVINKRRQSREFERVNRLLRETKFEQVGDEVKECAICMLEFKAGDNVIGLPCNTMYLLFS